MRRWALRLTSILGMISGLILLLGTGPAAVWGAGEDTGANQPQMNAPVLPEAEPEEGEKPSDEAQEEAEPDENPAEMAGQIANQIAVTVDENSAEDLLNLATEAKLSAESVLDLTKVITYCIEAEKKGLDDTSLDYCRQLKIASQLERGLSMADRFMGDNLDIQNLPQNWNLIRSMALDDLNMCVESSPNLAVAYLAIGRLEMLPGGDEAKAKEALDAAIAAESDQNSMILAEALKFRSILASKSEEGLDFIQRAINLNPESAPMLGLLASRLSEVHQDEKALETIDKALELEPDNKNYKKAKAFILGALDRYEEAEALFDEAIAGNSKGLAVQVEKAQFLSSLHQNDKAVAILTDLIKEHEDLPFLYFFRGSLLAQEKEYTKAIKDANQALWLDLNFTEAIQLKGVIYLQQKKTAEAVRAFKNLLQRSEDKISAATQLAYAQAQNDDFRGAMKTLEKQLKENPESSELLRSRGDIELLYGQFEAAIGTYKAILEKDANDSGTLNNYSWLLSTAPDDSVRNGALALEMAQKAAELTNYKESHILSTLGAAYAETGNFEEALKWSDQAVALGEREKNDRLDDLKNEGASYREQKPWRETPEKSSVAIEPKPSEETPDEETEFF